MWLIELESKKEADRILREGLRNLGNFSFSGKMERRGGLYDGQRRSDGGMGQNNRVSSSSLESFDPKKDRRQLRRLPSYG